ncbi:MAG: hypothetical protein QW512_05980 [Thermofilaceae archaeon]
MKKIKLKLVKLRDKLVTWDALASGFPQFSSLIVPQSMEAQKQVHRSMITYAATASTEEKPA